MPQSQPPRSWVPRGLQVSLKELAINHVSPSGHRAREKKQALVASILLDRDILGPNQNNPPSGLKYPGCADFASHTQSTINIGNLRVVLSDLSFPSSKDPKPLDTSVGHNAQLSITPYLFPSTNLEGMFPISLTPLFSLQQIHPSFLRSFRL